MPLPANPDHGTASTYFNGCRCLPCSAAAKEFRERGTYDAFIAGTTRKPPLFLPDDRTTAYDETDPRHGTLSAYTQGCRCPWCIEAGKAHRNAKKLGIRLPKGYNVKNQLTTDS